MHDPLEGVTSLGTIRTGASRDNVAAIYEPVLDSAITAVRSAGSDTSLYLYGSVATGMAQPPISDIDLLTVGLPTDDAVELGRVMSGRFADLCRAVEVAVARRADFRGEGDEAYGGRVFLRHYCVHLTGPEVHSTFPDFAADAKAARGFNGDIAQHAARWRMELNDGRDVAQLSRRLARKSLLAVACLVSVHDRTWTTDRTSSAARWAEIEPAVAADLGMLLTWSNSGFASGKPSVEAALDGVVAHITASFGASIGFWGTESSD